MTGFYLVLFGVCWTYWIVPRLAELEVRAWQRRRAKTTS